MPKTLSLNDVYGSETFISKYLNISFVHLFFALSVAFSILIGSLCIRIENEVFKARIKALPGGHSTLGLASFPLLLNNNDDTFLFRDGCKDNKSRRILENITARKHPLIIYVLHN